ncbi:MAG: J domain-containing protein [Kordiimonadaceae bacterium]|nr:J domain-containing protein [Kordiimonadaceae bacterium]
MAWLLLGLMLAGGLLLMLQWWANAEVGAAKSGLMWGIIGLCAVFGIILLAAGRNVMALLPAGYAAWRMLGVARMFGGLASKASSFRSQTRQASSQHMTHAEALDVLGLQEGATKKEIKSAYLKLMSQCHPDKGGSDWMAAKLTDARQVLLDA